MQIKYHKEFLKSYRKRIAPNPKLVIQFQSRFKHFLENPKNPKISDHKLIGKLSNYRSFSVTGDIRVIYTIEKNELWLYDIGSHNQVY